MDVRILSHKAYTPSVALHDAMQHADDSERVAIVLQRKNGTVETYLSSMPISQAAYLSKCLDRRVLNLIEASAGG